MLQRAFLIALLAFVSILAIADQASAMYHARLGRFIQRDLIGYPDGLNAYAGFHMLRSGVDPMGQATYVPGMGKFGGSFGPLDKEHGNSSSFALTFQADVEAFKKKSCCTEVRFIQLYYATIDTALWFDYKLREQFGGVNFNSKYQSLDSYGDEPYYDTGRVWGNPQKKPGMSEMHDAPAVWVVTIRRYTMDFITCAVCSKSEDGKTNLNDVYGCILWKVDMSWDYNTFNPFSTEDPVGWTRKIRTGDKWVKWGA